MAAARSVDSALRAEAGPPVRPNAFAAGSSSVRAFLGTGDAGLPGARPSMFGTRPEAATGSVEAPSATGPTASPAPLRPLAGPRGAAPTPVTAAGAPAGVEAAEPTHDLPIFARQPDMEGDSEGTRLAAFASADLAAPGSGPKSLVGTRLSERLNEVEAPPSAVKFRGRADFRPGDIYPESLLRYLCMCSECGFKINERIACCMRCELEHRIVVMESAVKYSRSGFYLTVQHADRVEFSVGALKLFETGDVGAVASLRRPPMFPSRSEMLAMKSA